MLTIVGVRTNWLTGVAVVLPWKFESLLYWAKIWCAPTVRVLVVSVAMPLLRVCGVPSGVPPTEPSKKVTVPVGGPEPKNCGDTAAVKVTDWFRSDGLT